jgi:hypothetical protein
MADSFLDLNADDRTLLDQVVTYYTATLKETPEAFAYLQRRGIMHAQVIEHFRLGYSDRSLGLKLPSKRVQTGAAIRQRLHRIGLFRSSGHEHFRGSLTMPIPAADGSTRIVDIYGRKTLGRFLRPGTPIHTHLNHQQLGVFNVQAFPATREIILCSSIWDALSFWCHGYRNVTTMFGPDALTADLLAALRTFKVQRVLTPCPAVVQPLIDAGLEVFTFQLPLGLDVNAFARQASNPADSLGTLLRGAAWEGRARAVSVPAETAEPELHLEGEEDDRDEAEETLAGLLDVDKDLDHEPPPESTAPEPPPVRIASPLPPAPVDVEADVHDDEVVLVCGNRRYRVRGMARNATLDALRVNILVTSEHGLHADTLDLYSARHRKMFQEQAAKELSVEEAVIKRDLGRLLLKLEEVQDARQQASKKPCEAVPDMTAAEREAALELLRDPHLLDRIVAHFDIVGEPVNKLVGYLAGVSRKLDTPLAVIVQSTSAAGKTTLMDAILAFMPPEDVVKFSAITGQSLFYMAQDSLRHKVLALVEEEGAARASYALKLLLSEGELRIASTGKEASTGRLVTQEYRVEGPVMLFLTTSDIAIDEDLLNRCLVLTVDEDRAQTRAIHATQRARQTIDGLLGARTHQDIVKLHHNAQRLLRPLLVANPYAERLTFKDDQTRTRRDNLKYLTLIKSIALLRQHQRPVQTVEHQGQPVEYIEVTLDDIKTANRLAAAVLGRCLDELPPQTYRLLELLDGMVTEACRQQDIGRANCRFTRRQLRETTGWGNTQLKAHLRRLVELEYVIVHRYRHVRRHLYELNYSGAGNVIDGKLLAGLVDVEQLRQVDRSGSQADRSGQNGDWSGHGRPLVGPWSGHGRPAENDVSICGARANGKEGAEVAENVNGGEMKNAHRTYMQS